MFNLLIRVTKQFEAEIILIFQEMAVAFGAFLLFQLHLYKLRVLDQILQSSLGLLLQQVGLPSDKICSLVFGVDINALSKSILSLVVLTDPSLGDTLHDVAVHFLITALQSLNHLDTHILITFSIHVSLWLIELAPQASGIREIIKIIKTLMCEAFVEIAETS